MSDLTTINCCPVCDSNDQHKFLDCVDYTVSKNTFTVVECGACSFRFTNPIPPENEIGKYYEAEDYVSHSDTKKGIINRLYHLVRNYSIKKKFKLVSRHATQNSLLDIGSGTGAFLAYAQEQNWKCLGLEPSEAARNFSVKTHSLDVRDLTELQNIEAGEYNTITMWHVLEHVHALNPFLDTVKNILQLDGTFFVAVPNCNSYDAKKYGANWAAYDVPRHLYHFRPDNMKQLMQNHGFKVAEILPMKFDSYYVSMLSEKNTGSEPISGFWTGMISNLKANRKNHAYSSLIYVIKHQ